VDILRRHATGRFDAAVSARFDSAGGQGHRVEWVDPGDFPRLQKKYRHDGKWKVFKTHSLTREMAVELSAGRALGIYIYRDLRDVVTSLMHKGNAPQFRGQYTYFFNPFSSRPPKLFLELSIRSPEFPPDLHVRIANALAGLRRAGFAACHVGRQRDHRAKIRKIRWDHERITGFR